MGLKQNDMMLRVGVSRQQYQRLESKGNPRLDTLELIAKGLNTEIMLVPKEKLNAVLAVMEDTCSGSERADNTNPDLSEKLHISKSKERKSLSDDPWQDLPGDE